MRLDQDKTDAQLRAARDAMEASEDAMTGEEVEAQHQTAAYAWSKIDRSIAQGGPLPKAWQLAGVDGILLDRLAVVRHDLMTADSDEDLSLLIEAIDKLLAAGGRS